MWRSLFHSQYSPYDEGTYSFNGLKFKIMKLLNIMILLFSHLVISKSKEDDLDFDFSDHERFKPPEGIDGELYDEE